MVTVTPARPAPSGRVTFPAMPPVSCPRAGPMPNASRDRAMRIQVHLPFMTTSENPRGERREPESFTIGAWPQMGWNDSWRKKLLSLLPW